MSEKITCALLYMLQISVGLWLSDTKNITSSSGSKISIISNVPPQLINIICLTCKL